MSSLDLQIGEMVQGKFELGQLNILLAFQVNCPGCFIHALPLASELHGRYQQQGVQVLGLSTVFEDFSLNTVENTCALIQEALLVGETARHFQRIGLERYDTSIPFPIVMDAIGADGIGQTFALNRFRGTPTWVMFDSTYHIKKTWFGHKEKQEFLRLIDEMLFATQSDPI